MNTSFKEEAAYHQSTENRGRDSNGEGETETTYRSSAKEKENTSSNERGEISVNNG